MRSSHALNPHRKFELSPLGVRLALSDVEQRKQRFEPLAKNNPLPGEVAANGTAHSRLRFSWRLQRWQQTRTTEERNLKVNSGDGAIGREWRQTQRARLKRVALRRRFPILIATR